jgi:DNA-binding NarL/FixJ family response regulator
MAHPLLGEAARASLSPSEFRRCLDDVTEAVLAKLDAYDTDLALRLVAQRCAFELFVPIDWLRSAAGRAFALLDHELAVTLGRRALDAEPLDVEANLVVGAGLSAQFLTADAEPHLRSALDHARTDSQRARSAGRLGLHLGTRLGRRDAALELMRQQLALLTEPTWRQFLGADIGKIELLAGQAAASPAGSAGDDPLAVLNHAIMGALVSSLAGDVAATRTHVERGLPLTAHHIGALPNGRDLLRLGEFVALLVEGDVVAAQALASLELEACRTGRDEPVGLWRSMSATAALTSGDPARAEREAHSALPLVAVRDFVGGLHPTTQALRAVALAQLGRFTDAATQIADIDDLWADDPRTDATVRQAQAWCTALERGQPVGAVLARAAADVAAAGMASVALPIAYDAVRLDEPETVVELLGSLDAAAPATIAALFHRHARAAATNDLVDLAAVADDFQARAMPVLAAEVKARMAAITTDQARARWLMAEAQELMRSAGLTTSPFVELAAPDDTTRLTTRQLEVARMAARRFRSKEIAAALGLSTRTVDNQLGQVYRALGVSSRDELSAALGPCGEE